MNVAEQYKVRQNHQKNNLLASLVKMANEKKRLNGFFGLKILSWPALVNSVGKKKLSVQAMFVFAAMKKLANRTWKDLKPELSHRKNRINWTKINRIITTYFVNGLKEPCTTRFFFL
ncbi:hypothetical protein BFP46_09480 [Bacillus licheniformis]|nr:hypothetical protein BFP47_14415 [Bacillus licheniformis]OJT69490.1 hypothetical protein BFP46_09480 [Bacillus licheniformis]